MKFRSDYEFCKVEVKGHLLIITLNRPEVMNAVHPPTSDEMAEVFDIFAEESSLWCAIVTGAGERAFSAGNDLKYQAMGGKMWRNSSGFAGLTSRFDLTKPVIAAVNGVAMGGGFEIALACDLIIASDKARFALPEPKVGLAALAGGLQRLPRQIGSKRAMGMILTGRHVSAQEGYELGFVNQVVPHDELMQAAEKWANSIMECSPTSIRASKQVVYDNFDYPNLEESFNSEHYAAIGTMVNSENFVEGPKAFAEKRLPNWKG